MTVSTNLQIRYENLYPLQNNGEDVLRRLKFTIGSYTKIKVKFFERQELMIMGDLAEKLVGLVDKNRAPQPSTRKPDWQGK